jgi:hypothetical protein
MPKANNFQRITDIYQPATQLVLESVMIGTQSSQGVSFTLRGREILASE